MNFFENEKLSILILVLFSAAIFLVGLGAMPLTDPDEVFYAETAKEMLNQGEYLTPRIFGEPQFEKPPLYYWLIIFSFKAFGINEFSSRFPSAIFGILGVIGIYLLGKLFFNKKTAFFSALVLATGIEYVFLARGCVTDMVLTVLILYAFLFFFYAYFYEAGRRKNYLLSAVFLGLAVITKGPVFVFLPFAIIGIYMLLAKELKKIKEIPVFSGAIVFLAVALPWYILAYKVHGSALINGFFGFHNVVRFLEPEHKIGDVFYYYVPLILGGFAPWSIFLPCGIWQAAREREPVIRRANLFLIIWFLVIFLFFSVSRTKLPTYIFPLFPVPALFVGRLLDVFLSGNLGEKMKKYMNISIYLFLGLVLGGMIGVYVLCRIKYPTVADPALVTGFVFVLFMALFTRTLLKKRPVECFVVFMISFAIFIVPLSYIILPEIGRYESSKEVSEKVRELMKPGEILGAETDYRRGVAFYTGRVEVPDVHSHDIITDLIKEQEGSWFIIKDKNHAQLYTDQKAPLKEPTYVVYKLGKKVIMTDRLPPDGKFLKIRSMDEPR